MPGRIPRCRQIRFTLTVWDKHTVVTVSTRDGRDQFEWDRRRGTADVEVPGERIGPAEVQLLASALLERLQNLV